MVDFVGIRPRDGEPRIIPASRYDLDQLERLRPDQPFAVAAWFKRDLTAHNWYWGLVTLVAEGIGMPPKALHRLLKFKAGCIAGLSLLEGKLLVELQSEGFRGAHAMDETEAHEFRSAAVKIIFRDYVDRSERPALFKQVEKYVETRPRRR